MDGGMESAVAIWETAREWSPLAMWQVMPRAWRAAITEWASGRRVLVRLVARIGWWLIVRRRVVRPWERRGVMAGWVD